MKHCLLVTCALFLASLASAEPGVTDNEVIIAAVNATSGPVAANGRGINAGAKLYIDKVNAAGGVNGRKIVFRQEDDGFEPSKTAEITRRLIEEKKTFLFFNFLGTPTSKAVLPAVEAAGIPFLCPRTGDLLVREPFRREVFNLRGDYPNELQMQVEVAVKKLGKKKIAVLAQNDALRTAMKAGVQKALAGLDLKIVAIGMVERNSAEIAEAYKTIAAADPEVVILGSTAAAAVPFIKQAAADGKKWVFTGSPSNNPIEGKLAGIDLPIYILQSVPNLMTAQTPLAKEFRETLKASGMETTGIDMFGVYEGYLNAALVVEGLKRASKNLNRRAYIKAMESEIDLGGYKVSYSDKNHNAKVPGFRVWTALKNNKIVDQEP